MGEEEHLGGGVNFGPYLADGWWMGGIYGGRGKRKFSSSLNEPQSAPILLLNQSQVCSVSCHDCDD